MGASAPFFARAIAPAALLTLCAGCGASAPAPKAPASSDAPSSSASSIASDAVPLLVVTTDAITLDGVKVGDASAIMASDKPRRVDDLFERLKALRAISKSHAIRVDVRDGASTLAAYSAIQTAAFAGRDEVHFARDPELVVRILLPKLAPAPLHTVVEAALAPSGAHVSWHTDRPCDRAPSDSDTPLERLDGVLARACDGGPCIDQASVGLGDAPFADVVRALAIIAPHGTPDLRVALLPNHEPGQSKCGAPIHGGVNGRLPPEVIQRVVRAAFDVPRACYEEGLRRKPTLGGKVTVHFVIGRDGLVSEASLASLSPELADVAPSPSGPPALDDAKVSACVVDSFRTLVFPKPEGGIVTVVYPLIFSGQ